MSAQVRTASVSKCLVLLTSASKAVTSLCSPWMCFRDRVRIRDWGRVRIRDRVRDRVRSTSPPG